MRKNIWENVYYRLNDETEIKLCVLFCIRYAELPISDIELKHFMLEATSVDFIDLCSAISSMQKDDYIKTVWRDEIEKFDTTPRGNELLDMFEDKIMASVRSALRGAIDEYFRREQEKAKLRCDIVPIKKDAYNLDIELKEGKNTLVTMSLFVGSRERAIALRRGFQAKPMEIYSGIVALLSEAEEKKDDENV